MSTVLGVLVAKHIRRAIFGDDSARESRDDNRRPNERTIRKLLVVSDRSHATKPGIAFVEHPVFHYDGSCGHELSKGGFGSSPD
ncbi:MAG: hypothetical protein WCC08_15305 [Terrimicrobiaceae bacterium]